MNASMVAVGGKVIPPVVSSKPAISNTPFSFEYHITTRVVAGTPSKHQKIKGGFSSRSKGTHHTAKSPLS